MRITKALGILAAGTFAVVGVYSAASAGGFASSGQSPLSVISPDERAARDQMARQELSSIQAASAFAVRLPSTLPVGDTYDRVMWESAKPEFGFAVWFLGPDSGTFQQMQLIEAPFVAGAAKDTLNLPGLTSISLRSGDWKMLQKPDEPGKGLWILVTVQDGVHIEVDGQHDPVITIADQV